MKLFWRLLIIVIPLSVAAASAGFDLLRISGNSMEPTLCTGDIVAIPATFISRRLTLHTDSLVVTPDPTNGKQYIIKRVVALGGDRIRIAHGQLVRNGDVVTEPYSCATDFFDNWPYGSTKEGNESYAIPSGDVFLMGDNRTVSQDSRTLGAIPISELRGLVVARLPFGKKCSCAALHKSTP